MRHTREEVIKRTVKEFKLLDKLVSKLKPAHWKRRLPRPETKDPWTVKDSLAHITYWKANVIRSVHGEPPPPEFRGLNETQENHLIYARWKNKSASQVLAWHRKVQRDLLKALRAAPDEWYTGKQRRKDWPYDADVHSAYHRVKEIEDALAGKK